MNKILTALVLALSLLFAGCATAPSQDVATAGPEQSIVNSPAAPVVVAPVPDIQIIDGQLIPDEFVATKGKTITFYVINSMDTKQRFSIPLYKSEFSEDIGVGEIAQVVITPTATGSVAMELNGAQVGTIIIRS